MASNVNYLKWIEIAPGLPSVAEDIYGSCDNVCPPVELVFRALELVGPEQVRVVILGQDPYHTPGKASGLAFGYHPEYIGRLDSSLQNIVAEVRNCGYKVPGYDDDNFGYYKKGWFTLEHWAKQGVLLLNTRLTVEMGKPMSHAKGNLYSGRSGPQGPVWEEQIEKVLKFLAEYTDTIFVTWGAEARKAADRAGAVEIVHNSHPCRYSNNATKHPFTGSQCFTEINTVLELKGKEPINWGS